MQVAYFTLKSTKVRRHKNEISENMGFVRIFWKNNAQEAYLPKMSISGQIVSEIVAQLCLGNSIQTLLNFFGVDPKKITRVRSGALAREARLRSTMGK